MTKKYEFTGRTRQFHGRILQEIRALVAIAPLAVNPGDKGGWIESETNLSQDGDAWVFPSAVVCGHGTIRGGTIRGGTIEGGTIWDGTIEGGTIWDGTIRGGTIWGDPKLIKPVVFLGGLAWEVTITDDHMTIGCQTHALAEWWAFDDRQIKCMDVSRALDFWTTHKSILQAICKATGRCHE